MSSKTSYTVVGVFVLVLSAAFVWGVLWISAGGPPQRFDTYLIYMTESVSGLSVDSPITYRGVDVGKVASIDIDVDNPERVRLLAQIQTSAPITEDTVAILEYQGLTGISSINLSGGRVGSLPLPSTPGEEYPVIPSQPSLFARLDASVSDLLGNLIQTSANINDLLTADNRSTFTQSLRNLETLTGNLGEQSARFDVVMDQLIAVLEHTREASEDFPALTKQLSRSAGAVTSMAEQVRAVGESIESASAGIEHAVDTSGADFALFTSTTLPEISALVAELRVASENLRRMSQSLADNPSVLIYGDGTPEPGPGE